MDENLDNIEENELNSNGEEIHDEAEPLSQPTSVMQNIKHLSGMFQNWFLDYASYVILERAVPHIDDGFKPVQRRILHAMKQLDDGRFNKVANIIGHTMQYHPHGDASINDALVQIGQREHIVDTQGNWGNILTGDSAAAPRYIESRLSKFSLEVIFNPKTTEWKLSYDGRNREPVTLPVKFPMLLYIGVEGIAVGLASKILPHNFNELIDASIAFLRGDSFQLFPDFPTGGFADCSRYSDGLRGGSVKIRAKINKLDKKTLVITDIPFGKTTGGIIESILKANDKGKIKIKKVDDNTAENVEIVIHLAPGTSPDITIDALYAFTDCEVSVSPNSCVIEHDKPKFLGVNEILRLSTHRTLSILKRELEIRISELNEDWHYSLLEKIFIENRIYIKIEKCETWESIIETIDKGLEPYKHLLRREVTREDITKLTDIKIKRISRFDAYKSDEHIKNIETEIDEVNNHLVYIVDYTVNYFIQIKKKYGANCDRKTEIRNFDTIEAAKVVIANEKLYVDRKEGFMGTSLKKDEFVCDCSDIDDIIVFRRDGKYLITKVSDKNFVGKDIIHIEVFNKNDDRTIYNIIYRDGKNGNVFIKRFPVKGVTRDKEYDVTKGTEGSKILYFSSNPNGEAEIVKVFLKPKPKLRKLVFEADFTEVAIKGRSSIGNTLSKNDVHKISLKEQGVSTLGGIHIWFDDTVLRLNSDERGKYLGEFLGDDKIAVITKSGKYRLCSYDFSNHFEEDIVIIEKYDSAKVFSLIHYDGEQKFYYFKRFQLEFTEKEQLLISEFADSSFITISEDKHPKFEIEYGGKNSGRPPEIIDANEFIAIKGFKARGKRISTLEIKNFTWLDSLEDEESDVIYNPQSESDNSNLDFEESDVELRVDETDVEDSEQESNDDILEIVEKNDINTDESVEETLNIIDNIEVNDEKEKDLNQQTEENVIPEIKPSISKLKKSKKSKSSTDTDSIQISLDF
ncbi:MAG: DNA topoisomerase IV [Bacteroidetes bacterium GWA2_30_7]|nr:MAG: DNA topoisomerase IV [Bacteroidetes bacterium GWA2_30_7]